MTLKIAKPLSMITFDCNSDIWTWVELMLALIIDKDKNESSQIIDIIQSAVNAYDEPFKGVHEKTYNQKLQLDLKHVSNLQEDIEDY